MTTLDDIQNELDRLVFESECLTPAERLRVANTVRDCLVDVGTENDALQMALTHERAEHDRWFALAGDYDRQVSAMRGEVDKSRSEIVALSKAAARLCMLLDNKPLHADLPDAIAEMRAAMRGERTQHFSQLLNDSIKRFDALRVVELVLCKLGVDGERYQKARDWAVKKLHP